MWAVFSTFFHGKRQKPRVLAVQRSGEIGPRRPRHEPRSTLPDWEADALVTVTEAGPRDHGYHVTVVERGDEPTSWEWEICHFGEPLPARIRDGLFDSQRAAAVAGILALNEFATRLNEG
jgi:hypothetical protein